MRQDTRDEAIGHSTGTAAGEGVVSITGQPGHVGIELRFWLRAPGRTRTCDPLLRRSFCGQRSTAAFLMRVGLLVVWLQLNVPGFCSVLARGWHGVLSVNSLSRAGCRAM